MPTRAALLAILSVSCAAMVLSVAVPVVIVPKSFGEYLFDWPCNHQPCNSVAEGDHGMPLRYPSGSTRNRLAAESGLFHSRSNLVSSHAKVRELLPKLPEDFVLHPKKTHHVESAQSARRGCLHDHED